jgi:putative PEP-CTERM system histidine kinase
MNLAAILAFAAAFFGGVMAFLVGWSERHSFARRIFVSGMALLTIESIFSGLSLNSASAEETVFFLNCSLIGMSLLPGTWLCFTLAYGRGNYRDFLKKWRLILGLAFLLPLILIVWSRGSIITVATRAASGRWIFAPSIPGFFLNLFFLVGAVLVLMNLERTFRAAVGTIRWRIKFIVLGVAVLFAARAYTSSQVLLFRGWDTSVQIINSGALLVAGGLMLRGLLRVGHFDLEVYPSQAVLRNSLTVMLAGIYLVVIGIFAKAVSYVGGDKAFSLEIFMVLVALVLLTTLLLSDRVRLYFTRFVSRHFQRPFHDYRAVWRSFSEATAACVTPAELCQAVVKLVANEFQILSATIWLMDENKERFVFGASTFLSESLAAGLAPEKADMAGLLGAFQKHTEPVDIDARLDNWAAVLRKCHPEEFRQGGNRVCVPLIVRGEVLGLVILGDRVAGETFSFQDFDLLKSLGNQIAACLLNLRLSQHLLRARELEAFQVMSAFFVHDLKNAASSLNLLLQNLPVHFDDPAFRQDALRGTAKTVAHINHLIERLGQLRHELKIKPEAADLNAVVAAVIGDLPLAAGITLARELRPLPKLWLDPEQMRKVVTNLVLNAREAVARDGQIAVQTNLNGGWAVLTVADNGCGMSPDFLKRSLFRAFQTSKKNGLGIGMFHSKMIVEAHQGRIEVESEPGQGTTFRVLLPLPA